MRYNCSRCIILLGLFIWGAFTVKGNSIHCDRDTTLALALIRENFTPGGDPGSIAGKVAESLVGTPVEDVTMMDSIGSLSIRVDGFDDMTFLNTVAAISRLATSPGHKRINELGAEIENLSYRRGEDHGFPSKMVYFSDWVVDNKSRKNVVELTENYSDNFRTKSLDKVTRQRDKYRALRDSDAYEGQKMVEMGFRTHKVPHLKRETASEKKVLDDMKDGDIVVLLTPDPSTDALEIGFVRKREDGFHFVHPSTETGKVVEEKDILGRYIKRNAKRAYGWRWLRLAK
ncbi:MAG: DUF1460 domain-containing protein [Muribaculaceae bacterium]|nr:DUF1460 domain-containing protein [Muribaculaceae bacterium]